MSRLGIQPIELPKDAKLTVSKVSVDVEGPKGKLSQELLQGIEIAQDNGSVEIKRVNNARQSRANHGTMRALLKNMLVGVTEGHKRELEIHGVGFRAAAQGQKLNLNLGFSHPVDYEVPKGISIAINKQTEITLEGPDNILLGQVAAKIRAFKAPEPYKGKGIRYKGEVVRRKQGKSVKK